MAGGKSGGDAYWPGFVDALTNVVIAMIFVVVVLAIALAFAAQMMGKKLAERYIQQHEAQMAAKAASAVPAAAAPALVPVRESTQPSRRIAVAGTERASAPASAQLKGARNTLQLDFAPNALTLDEAATQQFKSAIAAAMAAQATRRVQILGRGPAMALSDNQRSAYLRVMATRNALLEAGVRPEQIEVRIDTEHDAPGASVNVSFSE